MPIVRIDSPAGYSNEVKDRIREGIEDAVDEAIDRGRRGRHPETRKWIYPSKTQANGELGAGLPTVSIDTGPGRNTAHKTKLASPICDLFERELGTRDVHVILRTSPSGDHIAAGEPLPVWRP